QRLALAIGPLRDSRSARAGEIDGLDGLARRGSYERLLLSEWLLLDEAPDEFLRRAAASEHAFLHLQRRQPGRTRRSIALLDAGPPIAAPDDLWLIGSRGLTAAAAQEPPGSILRRASSMVITDRLEPGVAALDVEIAPHRGGAPRRLELSLPSGAPGQPDPVV